MSKKRSGGTGTQAKQGTGGVRLFRQQDQDFTYRGEHQAAVLAYVNSGNSDTMGGRLWCLWSRVRH